jgi:hypothetical protein
MLPSHEPCGEDPDDRHEKRERGNRRRCMARQQPVPGAVAKEGRDDDDRRCDTESDGLKWYAVGATGGDCSETGEGERHSSDLA